MHLDDGLILRDQRVLPCLLVGPNWDRFLIAPGKLVDRVEIEPRFCLNPSPALRRHLRGLKLRQLGPQPIEHGDSCVNRHEPRAIGGF